MTLLISGGRRLRIRIDIFAGTFAAVQRGVRGDRARFSARGFDVSELAVGLDDVRLPSIPEDSACKATFVATERREGLFRSPGAERFAARLDQLEFVAQATRGLWGAHARGCAPASPG